MNVTAHQEKEKNEKTKTGKSNAEEHRRQATNFKVAVCCRSGGSAAKNGREVLWVTETIGKANIHFDTTQTRSGTALPR